MPIHHSTIPASMRERIQLAEYLAHAGGVLGPDMRGNPAGILAAMYAAETLGVGLWATLTNLQVIDGKAEISATMMRGLVYKAGHDITDLQADASVCHLQLTRTDGTIKKASFTIEEAKTAELIQPRKLNWHRYVADMLYARATSRLVRRHAPEVLTGNMYVHGETIGPGEDTEETDTLVSELVERSKSTTDADEIKKLASEAEESGVLYALYGGHSLRTVLAQRWKELSRSPETTDTASADSA